MYIVHVHRYSTYNLHDIILIIYQIKLITINFFKKKKLVTGYLLKIHTEKRQVANPKSLIVSGRIDHVHRYTHAQKLKLLVLSQHQQVTRVVSASVKTKSKLTGAKTKDCSILG